MYIKRKLEKVIKANLFQGKVIVVYGARQVGKTTLVRKIAEETADTYGYLNCDELDVLGRLQNAGTSEALRQVIGDQKLVVIDEAQRVKNIGLKLKLMVDNFPGTQIIATGSSSFDLANEVNEPLTGRSFEFWLFRLTPYSGNLRKAIGKLRKIYFLDLGIRNAVINNLNPLQIRDDVGKLWENFVISEKYKQQLGLGFKTNYYFWRTYDKQEVDLVEDRGGKLRGWEIKWSGRDKKPPRAWSSYKNASWKIINRDNYLGELAGKKI